MSPEEIEELADLGKQLWRATFTADTSTIPQRMRYQLFKLMLHPKIGDFVLEITSRGEWDPDRIGHLVDMEGVIETSQGPLVERFVIAPLHEPNRRQGWVNASVVTLPLLEPGPGDDLVMRYASARSRVQAPSKAQP